MAFDVNIAMCAEWRTFGGDSNSRNASKNRCGIAPHVLLAQNKLAGSSSGLGTSGGSSTNFSNLTNDERKILSVDVEFKRLVAKFGLCTEVGRTSAHLYADFVNKIGGTIIRRNTVKSIKGACLYHACRNSEQPREIVEIAQIMEVNVSVLTKGLRTFEDIMGAEFRNLAPISPCAFVDRLCQKLDIPVSDRKEIHETVQWASMQSKYLDCSPRSLVGGMICHISAQKGLGLSKEMISQRLDLPPIVIQRIADTLKR